MHMLFQSEAAYRRRRSWMPREGGDAGASTALVTRPKVIGPRRPRDRGKSRSCKMVRREASAAKRRTQKEQPEFELDSGHEDGEDNQKEEENEEEEQEDRNMLLGEVRAMQMEIEALQQRRLLLDSAMVSARTNAVAHAIDLTKGFYVHFSNGFDPLTHPEQSKLAESFLRGIMRKDVICTEFRGVDLFLNQYKVCTEGHTSMRVFVHDIVVINENLSRDAAIQILAKATAHFRVSRATLEKFFPRIIDDEELAQQLIGKEYAIQYDKVFHFKHGQVFQHESQVDFCNSMLQMAQNPFVAMKLLEASLMTKHGHLKVDTRIEEDMNQLENTVL
ncbi:ATE1 protein [Phytophthora cinnamomi]|uniref:ATE1 protein n=1 Tax=Phytophthora cinnamomi TaxID=4785 RepID=UPI00355A8440|nr:ATE1 protein [Phytophthora cinnamomi]